MARSTYFWASGSREIHGRYTGDTREIHGRYTGGMGVLLGLGVVGVEGEHALVVLARYRG